MTHMLAPEVLALIGLFLTTPGGLSAAGLPSGPCQETYALAKEQARSELLSELENVAAFCQKTRAYLERDRTYELILTFDQNHAKARKSLKYRLERKTNKWIQGKYTQPKAAVEETRQAAEQLREEKIRAYCDTVQRLIESHTKSLGRRRGETELIALLQLDPENPSIREYRGDIRVDVDGRVHWMMKETVQAREQRPRMRQLYKHLVGESNFVEAEIHESEASLGFEWTARCSTGFVTVLGTTTQEEVEDVARKLHAAWEWLPTFLGGAEPPHDGLRVYLVDDDAKSSLLIENYPGLSAAFRAQMRMVESAWMGDDSRFGCWGANAAGRLDMTMRQTISLYFSRGYGTTTRHGWIDQSLGMYLTHRLVGTRLSFSVQQDERSSSGPADIAMQIYEPEADYNTLARSVLKEKDAQAIAVALGKDVNAMGASDLLLTYALSGYLLESYGRLRLASTFARCGGDESSTQIIESELGMGLAELRLRLLRWLGENPS